MKQSESIANLAKAFVAFKTEHPPVSLDEEVPVKMTNGGTYTFKFASLPGIKKEIEPYLTKNGLTVSQLIDEENKLTTILMHVSGEFMCASMCMNEMNTIDKNGVRLNSGPQDYGKIVTYGRRYAYCAVLGLIGDSSDDSGKKPPVANNASSNSNSNRTAAPAHAQEGAPNGAALLPWLNMRKRDGSVTNEGGEAIKHMTEGPGDLDTLLTKFRINKETKDELLKYKQSYLSVDKLSHLTEYVRKMVNQSTSIKELEGVYALYKGLQDNEEFKDILGDKKKMLSAPKHTPQLN